MQRHFDPSKAEKFAEGLYRMWQYRDTEEIQEGRCEAFERNELVDEPFVHVPIRGVMDLDYGALGEEVVPPSQAEEHEIAPVNHEDPTLDFAPHASQIEEEELITVHLDQGWVDLPHWGFILPEGRLLDAVERDNEQFLDDFGMLYVITPPPSEAEGED